MTTSKLVPKQTGQRLDPLTEKQRQVAVNVGRGMSWHAAARHAGYKAPQSDITTWRLDPRFLTVVANEREMNAKAADVTRKVVMDGLLEAVQMSKLVSDPHALIKAWREIGLMCGYYAPEIKRIDISITAKRAITQLEQLTDDELLLLAEKDIAEGTSFVPDEIEDAEVISSVPRGAGGTQAGPI